MNAADCDPERGVDGDLRVQLERLASPTASCSRSLCATAIASWRGSAGTRRAAPVSCASFGWRSRNVSADSVQNCFRRRSRRSTMIHAGTRVFMRERLAQISQMPIASARRRVPLGRQFDNTRSDRFTAQNHAGGAVFGFCNLPELVAISASEEVEIRRKQNRVQRYHIGAGTTWALCSCRHKPALAFPRNTTSVCPFRFV